MAERALDVSVQIDGEDLPAGRLWTHRRGRAESATFTYFDEYLTRPEAYALAPDLDLSAAPHQTAPGIAVFGAFADCAPDRWGRRLVARSERDRATQDGDAERSFGEADLLRRVRDDLRQGALRFRDQGGATYLADERRGVPSLMELGRLLHAADLLERDEASSDDVRVLLRGGSSLGGARPKAHVRDLDGRIAIAKFPSPTSDDWDVMRWEEVALTLAEGAGIVVPGHALHVIDGKAVLVVGRFDRAGERRLGYASAMTMLEARDDDGRSYLEIADVIERESPRPTADLRQLWRRMALTVLISNTDDHLRNHGFLRERTDGWSLSPAFDVNPDPAPGPKHLSTAIDFGDDVADVDRLMGVAEHFRLDADAARAALRDVVGMHARWRESAQAVGLSTAQIDHMAPAFEHDRARRAAELVR